jgi:tripartite-type tricarboxylate transporter receptor subunit TctC
MTKFAPVGLVVRSTVLLLLHPSVPVQTVAELVAYVKSNPGKLNAGNAGPGSAGELLTIQFMDRTGIKITQIPYKGAAPALQALLANEVQVFMADMGQTLPHIQAGKLRAIAQLNNSRSDQLPQVPTLNESVPGFEGSLWIGLVARAGTPPAIIEKLNHLVNEVMSEESFKKKAAMAGATVVAGTPQDFGKVISSDYRTTGELIHKYNIKFE